MADRPSAVPAWMRSLVGRGPTVIPVVRLQGTIAADPRPGRLNIATVAPLLRRAFSYRRAPVIAVVVNSPGGSPVQSRLIARRIRDHAEESGQKVLVFVEDAAASGGYFIAAAGDEIIADPSSIVGSVGVIFAGFGFVGALEKLGIERRVHTAGKNKSTLDPFLPEKPEDVERIKALELDVHETFIEWVKARRSGRLRGSDEELFTGEFWSGRRGLELGLVDGIGDLRGTLRQRYGEDIQLKVIEPRRGLLGLPRLGFAAREGAGGIVGDMIAAIEERALWSRLGL